MSALTRLFFIAAAISLAVIATGALTTQSALWQPAAVTLPVLLAMAFGGVPALRSLRFTAWLTAAVAAALIYPAAVATPGGFNLREPWRMLVVIQCVMFGMGTQMSLSDFRGVVKMPWPVAIGFVGQFTIMPLCGFALTKVFSFPPEIAAGVILIGCCPSGLASNVMSYIARANLPLGVTITACTTVAAPVMTPLMMKLLAGTLVDVSFVKMMMETVKLMIVPLTAAFVHDWLKSAGPAAVRNLKRVAVFAGAVLLAYAAGGWGWIESRAPSGAVMACSTFGYLCAAVLAGLAWHTGVTRIPQLMRWMPALSMFGIIYVTSVTTAAGRESLLRVGPLLLLAAALHNCAGYLLGYWLARAASLPEQSRRTVAFEVGLQNGGLGVSLATQLGMAGTMGLASTVFSPWMNVSGSLLANWWRRRAAIRADGTGK